MTPGKTTAECLAIFMREQRKTAEQLRRKIEAENKKKES